MILEKEKLLSKQIVTQFLSVELYFLYLLNFSSSYHQVFHVSLCNSFVYICCVQEYYHSAVCVYYRSRMISIERKDECKQSWGMRNGRERERERERGIIERRYDQSVEERYIYE